LAFRRGVTHGGVNNTNYMALRHNLNRLYIISLNFSYRIYHNDYRCHILTRHIHIYHVSASVNLRHIQYKIYPSLISYN
jgi:hypothetical protein